MFTNYTKRASIDNYGGIPWTYAGGYEEVINNGIPTFYAVDIDISRVVKFDSNWNYQTFYDLSIPRSFTLKYINGYFYFSAEYHFYKTDTSFTLNGYSYYAFATYRQFAYDSNNSLFYVAAAALTQINVYDTTPSFVRSISFPYSPYSVYIYYFTLYVGFINKMLIAYFPLSNPTNINYFTAVCSMTVSIFIESFSGDMFTSCENTNRVDSKDMGGYIQASSHPYIVAVDTYRRLIINTQYSIDIYY
jgi:hypothetical protein